MKGCDMRATTSKFIQRSKKRSEQWKPDAEQLLGIKWLVQRQAAALFLDPGAGKTSIVYAACKVLKSQKMFSGALVFAPFRPATSTWPAEQQKWEDFHGLDVVVLHGKDKDRLVQERHDIYVVNYEGIQWLIANGHLKRMLALKWLNVLVFDELTNMKNASKKKSKSVRRNLLLPLLPRFERRWGLTGSPGANGLIHLFGQVNVLDLGAAFGPYITHYRTRFFDPVGAWGWVLKAGADELIYERLKPLALRTTLGNGVKLPEIKNNNIIIELPEKARKAYDEMEEEMITILSDDRIAAGSASAVYGKCWQIANGAIFKSLIDPITGEPFAKRGATREWHAVHDEKLDALEDLVEEIQGQQILVAYWFQHDLERLQKRFGNVPYIGSGVSVKLAKEYEAAWNAGEISIMLGHPQSMAHGMNFQDSSARHVAWFSLTPNFELYDQFIRRLRRRGNKAKRIFVHHFIARQTIDAWAIMPSLRRKDGIQLRLFDALRQQVKSGEYKKYT